MSSRNQKLCGAILSLGILLLLPVESNAQGSISFAPNSPVGGRSNGRGDINGTGNYSQDPGWGLVNITLYVQGPQGYSAVCSADTPGPRQWTGNVVGSPPLGLPIAPL